MCGDDYGRVMATLRSKPPLSLLQGVPGDDRCVLLLGYEEQMEAMMRGANPGLARRFQWQDPWRFEDYSQEDLFQIMKAAAWGK